MHNWQGERWVRYESPLAVGRGRTSRKPQPPPPTRSAHHEGVEAVETAAANCIARPPLPPIWRASAAAPARPTATVTTAIVNEQKMLRVAGFFSEPAQPLTAMLEAQRG